MPLGGGTLQVRHGCVPVFFRAHAVHQHHAYVCMYVCMYIRMYMCVYACHERILGICIHAHVCSRVTLMRVFVYDIQEYI